MISRCAPTANANSSSARRHDLRPCPQVDQLLLLADSAANQRLKNATDAADLAVDFSAFTQTVLDEAQAALFEAEADYAIYEEQAFSADKVASKRRKQVATQAYEQARVHVEQAAVQLESANRKVDEVLALIERIRRVEAQGLSLDALVAGHSDLFIQLGVDLPDNHVDVGPTPAPVEDFDYEYYEPAEDTTSTIVSHIAAPPPSPAGPVVSALEEIQGEIMDIAQHEMEDLQAQAWAHPVAAAAATLLALGCCCCCFYRCCGKRSTRAVIDAETDQMPEADEGYEDEEDDEERYDDIELQERDSNGRGRSSRARERDGLNFATPSDEGFSSTRAHRGGRNGRSKRGAHRIP